MTTLVHVMTTCELSKYSHTNKDELCARYMFYKSFEC